MSGGYSVITVPSREPTNQTKRDKDKQRFEPTSVRAGERIKRRHAERGRKGRKRVIVVRERDEKRRPGERWVGTEEAQQALVKYDVRSLPFVQLVATRRNATASSLSPSSSFPSCSFLSFFSDFSSSSLSPDFRCTPLHPPRAPLCNRVQCIEHLLSSIDRLDSIEGPEKGPPRGPDKDDAVTDSGNQKAKRIL